MLQNYGEIVTRRLCFFVKPAVKQTHANTRHVFVHHTKKFLTTGNIIPIIRFSALHNKQILNVKRPKNASGTNFKFQ